MIQASIIINTRRLIADYLSTSPTGLRVINGAAITANPVIRAGLPNDVAAFMLLIEEPIQGWSTAVEVLQRGGRVWRTTIEGHYGDHAGIDDDTARRLYLNWLLAT